MTEVKKIKVRIDSSPLYSGHAIRGMGFYTKNLISAMKNNSEVDLVDSDPDVVHFPYFDLFQPTLKIDESVKTVVTVPDVIPLLYPKHYPSGIRGMLNLESQKKALKKVSAVITISETSKKDIVRLLGVDAGRIHVIHLAPGNKLGEGTHSSDLPKNYILYVGDVNWNKNIIGLIKAVNKLGVDLVIVGKHAKEVLDGNFANTANGPRDIVRRVVGKPHPEIVHFQALRKLMQDSSNIHVLGFVQESELSTIYNKATAYCQPSFYEGFGLSVLEAFWALKPVACSRTQALVEVAGGGAVYFDPHSVEDMADKLNEVMSNKSLRDRLVKAGKERLREFSWKNTAELTAKVYKDVA